MRAKLLILASSIGMLGWGAVLPYQYAYAAETREWGALVAAAASSLFSVGALIAAPIAGRLSDRIDPVRVTVIAQLVGGLGVGALVLVDSAAAFLVCMFVFGLGLTAAVPAKQVLVLRWSSSDDRRKVFAYKFTGESLGMAAGAFLAGLVVDLDRPDGLDLGFMMAAAGFAISSLVIWLAGRGASAPVDGEFSGDATVGAPSDRGGLRAILGTPALRWTAVITVTLALGFYAQFESGLPAYGITVLGVDPAAIGTAAAVNCIVIVALQVAIVRLTARRSAASLLMVVGGIWVLSWLVLSFAQFAPGVAPALFVMTYGIFAVGETLYSPVLNPLVASIAPKGRVGQTLGVFGALQTSISALGPLVAGALLGLGLSNGFLALHVGVSVLAVFAAWRLRRAFARASSGVAASSPSNASWPAARTASSDAPTIYEDPPTTPVPMVA
ncbi:MAG TPA: MFS transporter [Agromyces sp.]|nr:MFS transporter [Agromyces sp.]